jgi:hypothetical protein
VEHLSLACTSIHPSIQSSINSFFQTTNIYLVPTYMPMVFNFIHPSLHPEITLLHRDGLNIVLDTGYMKIYKTNSITLKICSQVSNLSSIHSYTYSFIHTFLWQMFTEGLESARHCVRWAEGANIFILLFPTFFLVHCIPYVSPQLPSTGQNQAWQLSRFCVCVCVCVCVFILGWRKVDFREWAGLLNYSIVFF